MNKNEIYEIPVEEILPNRFQPRLSFDQKALMELAESIKVHGIIQPLVVRRLGDKFEIIAGERRYKAASLIGLRKVPVIIMDVDDNKSAELAVVENIQRKEMSALEEARSFKKILDKSYLTQEQLAARMGKSQSAIANKLRLLNLSQEVQDALLNERISERHARSLLQIESIDKQNEMLNDIINKKLTVKQTDDIIKETYKEVKVEKFREEPVKKLETLIDENIFEDINPQIELISKISRETENKIDEPIEANIGIIKEQTEDIIKPEPEKANVESLMQSAFDNPFENKSKNRFLMSFEDDSNIDFFDIKEDKKDLNVAKENIKESIKELKEKGYKIDSEEFDYEKQYQFIIKIEKE
jgi:ParB family chromosome partitioning protein